MRSACPNDAANEAATTLQTLLSLRLVRKELADLLHPAEGAALWQKLVLLTFDFSTSGRGWNIDTYEEDEHARDNREADAAHATDGSAADLYLAALEDRGEEMPESMLDEDFVLWDKLGIYHRPSQYGFFTTLQQEPPTGRWPSTEDPFSLFHDLILLLRLPDGKLMETGGEGGDTMDKCIVAPVSNNNEPSSPFYRYRLMQTLGYAPHFWRSGRGIGDAWRGFTDPNADAVDLEQQQQQQEYHFWYVDSYNIPYVPMAHAETLFKCIQRSYCDWRSVCCNSGSDGETPVFFVGKSKSQPHRWTGYCGAKTWT